MVKHAATLGEKITLAQLRAAVAVADTGSFGAAALELGLAQSTLSNTILELERALGKRIFDRGRKGASTTRFGILVLEHARETLTSMAALEQRVALERGGFAATTLRVASLRSVATHVLPGVIQTFGQSHPKVRFEIIDEETHPNGVEGSVLAGRADLGLMNLHLLQASHLVALELLRDEYVVLLKNQGQKRAPTWQEIQTQAFIGCSDPCQSVVLRFMEQHGVSLQPSLLVGDDSAALSMVAHGIGIAILPSLAAHPLPLGVAAFPMPDVLERRLGLVMTRAKSGLPVVKAFTETLQAWVKAWKPD